jgi:hypothetical protein
MMSPALRLAVGGRKLPQRACVPLLRAIDFERHQLAKGLRIVGAQ